MINVRYLQIGDWVMCKDFPMVSLPTKIKKEHFLRSLVEFEPIEFTIEMAIKIGYIPHGNIPCNVITDDEIIAFGSLDNLPLPTLYYKKETNTFFYNQQIELKYVHEFQHLLRLMNIDFEFKL